jgi:twitching motility protein PilT
VAEIDRFLELVVKNGGTDLLLMSGSKAVMRIYGQLRPVAFGENSDVFTHDAVKALIYEILSDDQIKVFEEEGQLDLVYEAPGISRFKSNIYMQSHGAAGAFRAIPSKLMMLDELAFPPSVKKLASVQRGLILVCGPSGCGKTTTLASMVDHMNRTRRSHIITIEDPIEYVHKSINSIITQRQVGLHAESFSSALRDAARQDPDAIMVGELPDMETVSAALEIAETGVLVLGSLHSDTASKAINHMINIFPPQQKSQVCTQLSETLMGVIAQHLLTRADGHGVVAAVEILLGTSSVNSSIRDGKIDQIVSLMETGQKFGMQMLDEHLLELVQICVITPETAHGKAQNKKLFE